MEIGIQILKIIFNAGIAFIFGFGIAIWLISRTYKLVRINKNDPHHNTDDVVVSDMDGENTYYVRFPDKVVNKITLEEPLSEGHFIDLIGVIYEVDSVVHIPNNHTIFNLKHA
jgi:hypothetical protein